MSVIDEKKTASDAATPEAAVNGELKVRPCNHHHYIITACQVAEDKY